MTPSRKLPGVLALHGGECPRCDLPIVPGRDRIYFVRGGVAVHVRCAVHWGKPDE